MDSGRTGREAVITRGGATAPRAKRKKAKPPVTADSNRPIPQPYLALAPRPLSSQARQQPSNPNLVLPSSFRRPTTAQSQSTPDAGPSRRRDEGERFASSLLAPPTVRAGGGTNTGAGTGRRAVSPNAAAATGGRRRTDRLRQAGQGHVGIAGGNASMTSLGHLGRIMESDAPGTVEDRTTTPAPRRRRRIVREVEDEGPGLSRRLTVSSREEGRAIGLARGASLRRLNVWDDVPPENDEPPPPFPFPTSSSSRLPPTFTSQEQPPIPNSPPPQYALTQPPPPEINLPEPENRPPSRTSTRYESAPSSPVIVPVQIDEEDLERDDRRMWNEDLLAGYSLEERVQREFARRGSAGLGVVGVDNVVGGDTPSPASEAGETIAGEADGLSESPVVAAIASGEVNTTTTESAEPTPKPITTPSEAPPPAPPVLEEDPPVEPTVPGDNAESKLSPTVESATVPSVTASSVVSAPERETPPAPIKDEPVKSVSENEIPWKEPTGEVSHAEPANQSTTESPAAPSQSEAITPIIKAVSSNIEPPELVAVSSPDTVVPTSRPAVSNSSPPPAKITAEPEIIKPTTRPSISSAGARRSLSILAETPETEIPVDPTSSSAPVRKLTRGKAIRRSSSGLVKTLTPTSPSEVIAAPLFSAARFDFGKSTTIPENDRTFVHRASAPEVTMPLNVNPDGKGRGDRRSEDHGFKVLGGRRLGDPPLNPDAIKAGKGKSEDVEEEVIPPHREAALLRRESILAKYVRPTIIPTPAITSKPLPPDPKLSPKAKSTVPSGPLIDFSDYDSVSATSHHPEIPGLVAANAELLELLEQEAALPQSSAQAAEKVRIVEDLRAQLQSVNEVGVGNGSKERERTPPPLPPRSRPTSVLMSQVDGQSQEEIKKKPPPPPPPIRARKWASGQKISIAETATSPITPRPSIRRPNANLNEGSPTRKAPPPLPTRRPPPPPPPQSIPMSDEQQQQQHPPPLFRAISEVTSTTSSMYDGENSSHNSTIAPLPTKPAPPLWRGLSSGKFDRSPQKPRGPRPAPPPPRRSWARVVSDRPLDRTHSEEVLSLNLNNVDDHDHDRPEDIGSTGRSNSEMDISRPTAARTRRIPEYTDLDVFVSRLQGSGREYEGFSHIAEFLGPAKSPAAPSEALSTLLPAPIQVESRRTTKEGKVKLKLSLLGVRVTKCPICLAQFREGEMGVLLPVCGHLGHEGCARRWFREDDRCFVCREKLKVEEGVV